MAESRLAQQYLIIRNQMLELCKYYFYQPEQKANKRRLSEGEQNDGEELQCIKKCKIIDCNDNDNDVNKPFL